jgi:hypothetical protein
MAMLFGGLSDRGVQILHRLSTRSKYRAMKPQIRSQRLIIVKSRFLSKTSQQIVHTRFEG